MNPKAIEVRPLTDYRLLLKFNNGEIKIYDAKPLIKGDWFGQLSDPGFFRTVHIAGLSVEWAGGQDVCPDDLYDSSIPLNSPEATEPEPDETAALEAYHHGDPDYQPYISREELMTELGL